MYLCGWSWLIVLHSHVGLPERLVTILQLVSNSVAAIQVQMQWLTLIILLQFNLSICSIHTIYWIKFKTLKIGFKLKRLQNHTFVTLPYSLLITFHHRIFWIFWIHPKGVFSSLSHHWILLTKRQGKLFLKNICFSKIKVMSSPKTLFDLNFFFSIFSLLGIKHTSKS